MLPTTLFLERDKSVLAAVLASRTFAKASSLQAFLRYICDCHFDGKGGDLKEYSIAVDVLHRGPDFDQRTDSIVRVEACRLRKRLKKFYETEGRDHAVQLVLPPGRYVPDFINVQKPEPPTATAPRPVRHNRWTRPLVAVALAVTLTVAIGLASLRRIGLRVADREARPVSSIPVRSRLPLTPQPSHASSQPAAPVALDEVHIMAGQTLGGYFDTFGHTWMSDSYFTGGTPFHTKLPIPASRDQKLFQSGRYGSFRYDIPLAPSDYELRLYFAESNFGDDTPNEGGETSRTMGVFANGQPLLQSMDVISDAGGSRRAYVRAFREIRPAADGFLHLRFQSGGGPAFVNAIEVMTMAASKVRPIRFVIRDGTYIDPHGLAWFSDTFITGGRTVARDNIVRGGQDAGLFRGERYGRFTYTFPLSAGQYTLRLYFAETWFGVENHGRTGVGSRIFDVFCNHKPLLKNFDILREAGGANRAICKTFSHLRPDAQGKLIVEFLPIHNYACVNAIEITED